MGKNTSLKLNKKRMKELLKTDEFMVIASNAFAISSHFRYNKKRM